MSPSAAQQFSPPPSPDVMAQGSPEMAQSVFAQQGLDQQQADPVQQMAEAVMVKLSEMNNWAGEMKNLIGGFDPSLMPYLQQIASAAVQLGNSVQEKMQRSGAARGSSVVPQTPPGAPSGPPPNPGQY